jgi:ribonuclease Z
MLDIALLGTGGMIPLHNRYLSAMLARCGGHMLLIDCGEGTQVTMRELGWGFIKLDCILFTHFHADHIAGLPGLLLSLSNYGRTGALTIVGPQGIENVVNSLRVIAPDLMYPVEFIELSFDDGQTADFKLGEFCISALPLDHGLNCVGYSISVPRSGKFDADRARGQGVPLELWSKLQNGEAADGFTPDMVLGPERKGIKVSYITDTRPIDTIPGFIRGSDLFICEGIYGDDDMKQKADRFYHMIASDAARIAKAGDVKELWLTHYSQSFIDPENCIPALNGIFKNIKAGRDRMTKTLLFEGQPE